MFYLIAYQRIYVVCSGTGQIRVVARKNSVADVTTVILPVKVHLGWAVCSNLWANYCIKLVRVDLNIIYQ